MASKTDKGSWSGERKPTYSQGRERDAARWLMNVARRFLDDKEPASALDEPVKLWLTVRAQDGDGGGGDR